MQNTMSETLQIWLFGGIVSWLLILTAGMFHVKMGMAELRTAILEAALL